MTPLADNGTAAAYSNVRLIGFGADMSSETRVYSANAPSSSPYTSSPGRNCLTSCRLPQRSRNVPTRNLGLRLVQPERQAGDIRLTSHQVPDTRIDTGGVHTN